MIESCTKHALNEGGKYLIAVSGGLDSMCLLHSVSRVCEELGLTLEAAHVNHRLRKSAEDDEQCVVRKCEDLGVPLHVKRLEKRPEKVNLEAWAREERYAFFTEVLNTRDLHYVLTAHHQGDLVETLLMRILANREPRQLMELNKKNRVVRPLLQITKSMLEQYAEVHRIEFREDESNFDLKYLRNKVRHSLCPFLLENFGEEVESNLANQAKALERELKALDELGKLLAEESEMEEFGSREWLNKVKSLLEKYPEAVGERLLRQLFLPFTRSPLGRESSTRVRTFLLSGEVAVQIPPALEIRRKDGGIVVSEV